MLVKKLLLNHNYLNLIQLMGRKRHNIFKKLRIVNNYLRLVKGERKERDRQIVNMFWCRIRYSSVIIPMIFSSVKKLTITETCRRSKHNNHLCFALLLSQSVALRRETILWSQRWRCNIYSKKKFEINHYNISIL